MESETKYTDCDKAGLAIKYKEPEPEKRVVNVDASEASQEFVDSLNQQFEAIVNDFNRMVEFVNNLAAQVKKQQDILNTVVMVINRMPEGGVENSNKKQ